MNPIVAGTMTSELIQDLSDTPAISIDSGKASEFPKIYYFLIHIDLKDLTSIGTYTE